MRHRPLHALPSASLLHYYLPLTDSSTDRQNQAQEDAGEGEDETAVGGKVDGRVLSTTDSGVRVGQIVHSGQGPVGPVSRSVSDTTSTTSTRSHRRRNIRDIIVIEPVCTPQACSHCCTCHLRHNNNGYGRCMKSANVPWPDCRCEGKCTAGRCAQVECDSNRVVVDLTTSDSVSESQTTTTLPETQSQQQSHNDRHPTGVSSVSHSSTLPSPQPGVRRAAGGVHNGEEVCAGPQAGTHASPSAAYRQPSATVADSRLVTSQAAGGVDGDETTAQTAASSSLTVQPSSR